MTTTRRVNLLPREIAAQRRSRQRAVAAVLAAVGVVAILVGAYLIQIVRLHSEESKLKAQEQTNTTLRAQLATLADYDALQKELQAKTALVSALTADEVRWSVVLADVSIVIPQDTWLTGFTGTVSAPAVGATPPKTPDVQPLGQIQLNGITFTHIDVSVWLTRLSEVDAFTAPYLTLSAKSTLDDTEIVNFNSSVQLSEKAFRSKQPGAQRKV